MDQELSFKQERKYLNSCGFTMIEVLVVMTVTVIIAAYTMVNYRSFGEDENLKNAALDLQSMIRQAQANATANVVCNTRYGATWEVYASASIFYLACTESSGGSALKKKLMMADYGNMKIAGVSGIGTSCTVTSPQTLHIGFAPLTGNISLEGCTQVRIGLQNTKTENYKYLIIEKGGNIYVE